MYANFNLLAAIASLTWLYAIALCFFFKTLEGNEVFKLLAYYFLALMLSHPMPLPMTVACT
jgi:hypothetical protein